MKNKKIILSLISSTSIIIAPLFSASCFKKAENPDPNVQGKKHGKGSVEQDKKFKEFLSKEFDELFKLTILDNQTKTGKDKSEFTADTITRRFSEIVKLELKPQYKDTFEIKLESVKGKSDRNLTGKAEFTILIKNKENNNQQHKTYEVGGFKTTPGGILDNGQFPEQPAEKKLGNLSEYIAANQQKRYEIDSVEYDKRIKRAWDNKPVDQARPELNYSKEGADKFNNIASKVYLPNYDSAAYKGYTLPKLNGNGDFKGLSIFKKGTTPNHHSEIDYLGGRDRYQSIGLARVLPNEFYKQIALETVSIDFSWWDNFDKEINEINSAITNIKKWQQDNNINEFNKYIKEFVDEENKKIEELKAEKELEVQKAYIDDKRATGEKYDRKIQEVKNEIDKLNNLNYQTAIEILEKRKKVYTDEKNKPDSDKTRGRHSYGTMWIMDYEIPADGKYPTKWYFGTNSHVARLMAEPTLKGMSITFINNQDVGILSKFRITGMDDNFTRIGWSGKNVKDAVSRVFDATDYLNTSPTDYLTDDDKKKYQNVEEMIDFAVIEVDFTKLLQTETGAFSNAKPVEVPNIAQDLAKLVTNNYFNRSDDKKVKFLSKSYLTDYSAADRKITGVQPNNIDQLFALGYPSAKEDFFLLKQRYENHDQIAQMKLWQSLWVNSDYRFYDQLPAQEGAPLSIDENKLKSGNYLSYQIGMRSFTNKPGINDAFIVSPIRGDELYSTYNDKKQLKQYFNTGLQYMLRHFSPIGGSSGSSVRNQKNEVIGVHSTIFKNVGIDFVAALRSEGYNYQGAFGKYNLPQYDLIYGGGKEQKNSYLESLIKKYGEKGIKTWLFKNGASKDNVPAQFKFNNNGSNGS